MKRSNSANLRLENLENRNLMAGDVTVNVLGGNLVIVGDDAANGIELTSTAEAGQLIVSGLDAADEATTINGEDAPLVVDGVNRGVIIRMGQGDDLLRFPQLNVRGTVNVRMGAGDDVVRIGDVEADAAVVEIGRALNVSLGTGNDRATVANTRARWIRASGGAGDDTIRTRDSASRSLSLNGGTGDDELRVNGARTRHLRLRGGGGDDHVGIVDSNARSITAVLGTGDDQLGIQDTEAARIRAHGAAGTDSLVTDLALEDLQLRGFEEV